MWRRIVVFLFAELAPVTIFFIAFNLFDFFTATKVLMAVTIAEYLLARARAKEPPMLPLVITIVVVIFASLTLIFQNSDILMFEVTFYHMTLGLGILIGLRYGKNPFRHALRKLFAIEEHAWNRIGRQWGVFLVLSGIVNELVREEMTESQWVTFRLGVAILMVVFGALQLRITSRARLPGTNKYGLLLGEPPKNL